MAQETNFIKHYIDQVISEECVIELNQLAREYKKEKADLTQFEDKRRFADAVYEKKTGQPNPNSLTTQLDMLDAKYKDAFKTVTAKHAAIEGVSFNEFKEPEPQKSVKEKSAETEKQLNEKQEAMNAKIEASIERQKQQQEQEQKPERVDTKEEQKTQLIEQMREQWGMNKEKILEPQKVDENIMNVELSREEKRAQLIEQMKQQSQEISRNKELNKDIQR
jgi:hypothetical protein